MLCPLCNFDLGEEYSSKSLVLRSHLAQKHIGACDVGLNRPAIQCTCGLLCRGLTSFSRHIVGLDEDERGNHAILEGLGQVSVAVPLKRGKELYARAHGVAD